MKRKFMRKAFSVLLAVVMMVSLMPMNVYAGQISSVNVDLDLSVLPELTEGMTLSEAYDNADVYEVQDELVNITASGGVIDYISTYWIVQVTQADLITDGDEDAAVRAHIEANYGSNSGVIEDVNEYITRCIDEENGWATFSYLKDYFGPTMTINDDARYGLEIQIASDEMTNNTFKNDCTVSSNNVTIDAFERYEVDRITVWIELGTLADIEEMMSTPDTFIDSVNVQLDWSKVPTLEKGANELPEFDELTATIEDDRFDLAGFAWAVKLNDSLKITPEDDYYDEVDEDQINDYNGMIESFGEVYGWVPLDAVLENPYYTINEKDVYSMLIGLEAVDGYTFGGSQGDVYGGEVISNVDIGAKLIDNNAGTQLVVFFELGTLADMDEAINGPSVHTHDWTGEWTIIKEATATEEGKMETFCVSGCGQKKVAIIPKVGEVDNNGNLEKDAEVAPEAPIEEATLNNSKAEVLGSNIFTDAEKVLIENGDEARVWLEIGKLDDTTITADEKADMEKAAKDALGEDATVTYFDATLFKKVGTANAERVPTPNIKMQITIVIPEELLNDDDDVEREYKIVRLHAGVAEVIEGTFDAATGEFTFKTDKFSPYGITYADTLVDDDDDKDDDDDDDDDDEDDEDDEDVDDDKNTTTGPTPGTDKKDEVPKTGEMNGTSYALTLMLLSGLGVCFSRKKEGNE